MRRKDRQTEKARGLEIIDASPFMVFPSGEREIVPVPVEFYRKGERIYFFGEKMDEKVIEVLFVASFHVPDPPSPREIEELLATPSRHRELLSRVFTTDFASAMVQGPVYPCTDREEKIRATEGLGWKNDAPSFPGEDLSSSPVLYVLEIEEICGKEKITE